MHFAHPCSEFHRSQKSAKFGQYFRSTCCLVNRVFQTDQHLKTKRLFKRLWLVYVLPYCVQLRPLIHENYTVSQKTSHFTDDGNIVKSQQIFKVIS